jgi:hypothetical protein
MYEVRKRERRIANVVSPGPASTMATDAPMPEHTGLHPIRFLSDTNRYLNTRPIYKTPREESAPGAALPGEEPSIPTIRADFPPFGPKSVHLSAKLPARLRFGK